MFANSAERLDWCTLELPDNGIFLFFLLLVFSNDSYPSAEDAIEAGGGGGFKGNLAASRSFFCTLSNRPPSTPGEDHL